MELETKYLSENKIYYIIAKFLTLTVLNVIGEFELHEYDMSFITCTLDFRIWVKGILFTHCPANNRSISRSAKKYP